MAHLPVIYILGTLIINRPWSLKDLPRFVLNHPPKFVSWFHSLHPILLKYITNHPISSQTIQIGSFFKTPRENPFWKFENLHFQRISTPDHSQRPRSLPKVSPRDVSLVVPSLKAPEAMFKEEIQWSSWLFKKQILDPYIVLVVLVVEPTDFFQKYQSKFISSLNGGENMVKICENEKNETTT